LAVFELGYEKMRKLVLARCSVILLMMTCTVLSVHGSATFSSAQGFRGILDTLSPVVTMPEVQGEFHIRPIWMKIASGHNSIPSLGLSWDLREDFGLVDPSLFLDIMVRIQVGRLGFRLHGNFADFSGQEKFGNQPDQPSADARFEYSGVRLGGDADILSWGRSRAGLNIDFDYFSPLFSESIQTPGGGKKIIGKEALTIGAHAAFVPSYNLWGGSPVVELRVRGPLGGAKVSEVEFAAGLIGPETVLGVVGLRGGLRRTLVSFKSDQQYDDTEVSSEFEATLEGWFAELVYYY
jgi:hypothetical protein